MITNHHLCYLLLIVTFVCLCDHNFVHSQSATKLIYNSTTDVVQKTLIRTSLGPISGLITVRNGLNVSAYLGLPYAVPPIGAKRRFADPEPIRSGWKKTYRAVRQPPICYQREWKRFRPTDFELVRELAKRDPAVIEYYTSAKSEDCLYLSVFGRTGADVTKRDKTVLVWIHGGAFISGTANLPFHDYPLMVASDPSLIVVAVNYRLNVFGFITTGDGQLSGNYGLKDQILALRWIKQNIGAFGGNVSNIVLWGQSAGAVGIGYHMMTNQSGDALFSRAIMESGNPLLPLTLAKSSYRKKAFGEFASRLNCTGANAVACLRAKSTEELFEQYKHFAVHSPLAFLPNVEDRSLFEFSSFWTGIREERFSFTGDILIGTNEAEGAQYVKVGPLAEYYSRDRISPNFTRANILAKLNSFAPKSLRSMIEPVIDMFTDGIDDQANATAMWNRYVQLVGDMVFVCPDYFFIKSYAQRKMANNRNSNNNKKANRGQKNNGRVYYYRFRQRVSKPFDCPQWSLGACHTDELQFVFGNPLLLNSIYPEVEQKLAKRMMSTWIEFAHRGHFTKNESFTSWRPFDPTKGKAEHLQIDLAEVKMANGFPGERCNDLCEPLYDTLESVDDTQMKLIKVN